MAARTCGQLVNAGSLPRTMLHIAAYRRQRETPGPGGTSERIGELDSGIGTSGNGRTS